MSKWTEVLILGLKEANKKMEQVVLNGNKSSLQIMCICDLSFSKVYITHV